MNFKIKNLVIAVFLGVLLVGVIGVASAQQVLPTGGDSFETAVNIQAGSYVTGHDISYKTQEYFKLPVVKAGQMLVVKATNLPTGVDLISNAILYNEDRVMLVPGYDNPLDNISGAGEIGIYRWLPNSSQNSYVYYISIGGGDVNFTAKGTRYDISTESGFDAGSQTDAGDTAEKAINITPGKYTGYLSGELGTDTKDFYKLAVKKGETLTVKVTPPSKARMKVVVYGSSRAILKDVAAPNPGAIVTNSVPITRSENVFAAVVCDEYCSEDIAAYTLNITIQPSAKTEAPVGEGVSPKTTMPSGEAPEALTARGAEDVAKAVGKGIATVVIFWIVGPIIFLIIIGIAVYLFLKRKRQ